MEFNRTKKIAGLIFIGIMICQQSFSQENFSPSYIVDLQGDTISGLINYRNWRKNPKEIRFKSDVEGKPTSYKPTDIKEFGVEDEVYISAIVKTEISPSRTDKLTYDSLLQLKTDTAFLQTLFKGEKSLYYYLNAAGKDNFYIKSDTGFELLIQKKYLIEQDGMSGIAENRKFAGQLATYLKGCPLFESRLNNTNYSKKSLTQLFQYYYECAPFEPVFYRIPERILLEVGVLAGGAKTSLTFKSHNSFKTLVTSQFDPSTNFTTGIFLDALLPRNLRKWSINNELLFTTYQTGSIYEEVRNPEWYYISTTEFAYSHLKLNNMLRYRYPINQVTVFMNLGVSNGYAIAEKNYQKIYSRIYSTERIREGEAIEEPRRHEQAFLVGAGAKYNKFSLEFRYENGNGMARPHNLNSITKRYYLLAGYKF